MDFINSMGCCTDRDGRAMLEEIAQPDNKNFPYIVMRRETVDGLQLSEPYAIPIKAEEVRDIEDYEQACAYENEQAEARGEEYTCQPPPFNVLWAFDNIIWDDNRGLYFNSDDPAKTYEKGDIVPIEDYRPTSVYCYYPEPQF